ncbi:MAG: Mrp/NBP35 family ATP-binding protein [Phycisphaerales bacterium]|nr:Mrp/NBP35 family ATP-binding protein [Phycisphaerales bacterium]
MTVSQDAVLKALEGVNDPDLGRDLVSLNMVKGVHCDGDAVTVGIELTTPACPMKDVIERDVVAAVHGACGDGVAVTVDFTAKVRGGNPDRQVLPNVKHVIAVGAGKGGVGKSTISTMLALGLSRAGAAVGLLDGDIYGPSLGTMLGLDALQATAQGNILDPFDVHGVKSMTIGKLVDPEKAMIWRGPMAHKAFQQLLMQTNWGELDYLIVDLPPGTGDVPLSLAQSLPLSGSVIVCTPQRVALDDARRAVKMFGQLEVPVLGVVENMSWFIDDAGGTHDLFGTGGAESMAQDMGLPFLGQVPMHTQVRVGADKGDPTAMFESHADVQAAFEQLAAKVAQQVSIASAATVTPTISVR